MTTTNFDSGSLVTNDGVTSATYSGWTFGASSAIDFANASVADLTVLLNQSGGRSIILNYNGANVTNFYFKSSDGSDFQLNSFKIDNGPSGASGSLTIAGYRDSALIVAAESVNLTTSDAAGNISYTQQSNVGSIYSGLLTFNSAFNNVDEIRFVFGSAVELTVDDVDISAAVVPPTITSAIYDANTNSLVVTGTNMTATSGALNDIDISKLTLTGQGGATYTLTSSNVEIDSATQFTVALNATDQINVEGLLNKNGTSSVGATTYNIAAAADWNPAQSGNADTTGNAVTVSNVQTPTITSATYDASTGILTVTGSNLVKASGATNDIDASKLTFTGEGGTTYTLTDSADVEITSGTAFTVTLSSTDKAAVNQIINKNGTSSTSGTTYNLAAAEDWAAGASAAVTVADLTGNGITTSNIAAPAMTSATYDYSSNVLTVTGTGFLQKSGASNDIDLSRLTITGEGGATYTLTTATNVEITSGTAFAVTLTGADLINVETLLNKNGTSAVSSTTYNLAGAEDWAAGADATATVADLTSNAITVSNYAAPTITSATFDASTNVLTVTGTNLVSSSGATNDVAVSLLTLTGEGGSYALTSSAVEVTSATSFSVTLNAADQLVIHGLLNKDGTTSSSATTYNIAAAEDWMAGTASSITVADLTGNGITVSNVQTPTITSATYDSDTGILVVTGTNLFNKAGASNDIDISTLTLTGGTASATYTIISSSDVEITSATSFSVTLSGTDKTNVDALLDQIGTTSSGGSTYNLAAADNWLAGANTTPDISDATNAITVSINPRITSATYDASSGSLVVTGTNLQANGGGFDIDASKLTFTGEGNTTYTLTDSADVEITSGTAFTVTLSATDKAAINQIVNKNGAASTGGTTYNLAAADDWDTNVTTGDTSDASGNGITASNVAVPAITSATYNASTGALVVTGTGLLKSSGTANDIDASKFTFTGEGGATYTLTDSTDVETTSGTAFTLTLSSTDKAAVNQIVNKNGTASTDATTYNLAAAEDWAAGANAAVNVIDATGNGITTSNVAVPAITSATYNASTGALVVTGTGFLKASGAANDIDASKFTFTGEGSATYTLTDSADVEITSGTAFTITLSATDKIAVNLLLNKDGAASTDATTYNLAAAEDWAAGADAAVTVADLTSNGITATISVSSSGGGVGGTSITTTTIDGTVTQTTIQPDGTVVTTIPAITTERQDDPSSLFNDYADIPVITNAAGDALLTASLPVGVGLAIEGQPQEMNLADAKDDLIQRIEQKTGVNSDLSQEAIQHAEDFLSSLAANESVIVQVITPTVSDNRAPNVPIVITGSNLAGSSKQILIIDTSNLPSGTIIQLDNVAFASIIGAVRVTGGNGENFVVGDNQNQFIVLGADDDILFGGGDNDTIGSLGGNDQTSGDAGNDTVYGGTGNDLLTGGTGNDRLNGGLGFDNAVQAGQLSDYQVTIHGNAITLTQNNGETDTLTDVESVRFASGPSLAIAYTEIEAVAHHLAKTWLGRDLTTEEGSPVQNWVGATTDDILAAIHSLPEAAAFQDKTSDELLAGLETNPNIIRVDAIRDFTGGDEDNQGYLPLGLAINADGGAGFDVLRMLGNRDDVHLEFVDNRLELTQLTNGAMFSIKSAEMITFDNNETVVIAHNQTEGILARLVHSFFNRDATAEEWQLGQQALNDQVDPNSILDWFQQHAGLQDLSDTDYVQTIYTQTLGRSATLDELDLQLSRLESNQVDRNWLPVEIAQSSEATTHLIGSVLLQEGWV